MITEKELNISNQSYTKKDFYQIYLEILDTVKKITARWDPEHSNESDVGVVLLKVLAWMADKGNYEVDKKVLEIFATSATQRDAMAKICDLMGYNMKYIQSATTEVSFMWNGDGEENIPQDLEAIGNYIELPKFTTNLKDSESTINYVLLEDVKLTHRFQAQSAKAIEGMYVELAINSDNIVLSSNLDANNRLYLPESQIAENGIFITSVADNAEWEKVDNLNVQLAKQKVWKFGFDSLRQKPYIQFPDDVNTIIADGLKVAYIRSSGINGNISARTLCTLENTNLQVKDKNEQVLDITASATNGNLTIQNYSATINGAEAESLNSAYKNFKRTVGTFETLVNCRDYANAIYKMVVNEHSDNTNLVSNVQVGDVTDDLNDSIKIATFDGYGVSYKTQDNGTEVDVKIGEDTRKVKIKGLKRFNIYLYPLNPIKVYDEKQFNQSFMPNTSNLYLIKNQLTDFKTVNHDIKVASQPTEPYLIKNYYSLSGKIITTKKLSNYEVVQVLKAVYTALYKNFNAREVNYGEAIPYDLLSDVILNADSRIKAINLDEPDLSTSVLYARAQSGKQEYRLTYNTQDSYGKDKYLEFVARNVLAGRAPLFNYDTDFKVRYNQQVTSDRIIYGSSGAYKYAQSEEESEPLSADCNITFIKTNLHIPTDDTAEADADNLVKKNINHTLQENESLQLISSELGTKVTYPAYVNYFLSLENNTNNQNPVAAHLQECTLEYMQYWLDTWQIPYTEQNIYQTYINQRLNGEGKQLPLYKKYSNKIGYFPGELVDINSNVFTNYTIYDGTGFASSNKHLAEKPTRSQFLIYKKTTKVDEDTGTYSEEPAKLIAIYNPVDSKDWAELQKIATAMGFSLPSFEMRSDDKIVEILENTNKFTRVDNSLYVNIDGNSGVWSTGYQQYGETSESGVTQLYDIQFNYYSLGKDGDADVIKANTVYQLTNNDYLLINYTDENNVIHNLEYKGDGTVYENGAQITDYDCGWGTDKNKNIIKVNFDLRDSKRWAAMGHAYAKKSGYLDSWNGIVGFGGMFSLGTKDEIEIKKLNSTKIKSIANLYWNTRNNQLIFTADDATKKSYSILLDDGEYVYYTDQTKSSLLTLGSGTKLSLHYSTAREDNTIIWTLSDSDSTKLSTDEIAQNGLSAFGDVNWQSKLFTDNNYLQIDMLSVKTFTQGDLINSISIPTTNQSEITEINSQWQEISQLKVNDIDQCSQSKNLEAGLIKHEVRAILNLNLGPNLIQTLSNHYNLSQTKPNTVRGDVIQEIGLYTSVYKDGKNIIDNGDIVNYFDNSDATYTESISTNAIKTWRTVMSNNNEGPEISYSLKSTINIQSGGSPNGVSTHAYSLAFKQIDNVRVYEVKEVNPTYIPVNKSDSLNLPINNFNSIYTKVSFKNTDQFTLPIYIPASHFGLIAVYCISGENTTKPTIEVNNGSIITYPGKRSSDYTQVELELNKIQVIKIWGVSKGCTLTFKAGSAEDKSDCTILVKDMDLVKTENVQDSSYAYADGINCAYLGIPQDPTAITDLLNKIIALDSEKDFYWNIPINNIDLIDEVSLDSPEAWFNKNNIFNKYVLSQLDTDSFENITIAKSSRLNN